MTIRVAILAMILGGAAIGVQLLAAAEPQQNDARTAKAAEPTETQQASAPVNAEGGSSLAVTVSEASRKVSHVELAPVRGGTLQPEIKAIGTVEADPARTFAVRAPVAGYLRNGGDDWPTIGDVVASGAEVGTVQPRLTPIEQFNLSSQYLDIRSTVASLTAQVAAARASYESKKQLNAKGDVSDRQLEQAESKLKSDEADLKAAQAKLADLEQEESARQGTLKATPVTVGAGGKIVSTSASPGEVVDSGQTLMHIVNLDRLIARIELPIDQVWDSPGSEARIAPVADEARVVIGHTVGQAGNVAPRTRGQCWLIAIEPTDGRFAPGAQVLAHLPVAGKPLAGVFVPDSAIVRLGGLAWVYVAESPDTFMRTAITLHTPTPEGWFVTSGLKPGEQIVVSGAQVLLSEQLKAQIEAEAEASE